MSYDIEAAGTSIALERRDSTSLHEERPNHGDAGAGLAQAMQAIEFVEQDKQNGNSSTRPASIPTPHSRLSWEPAEPSVYTAPGSVAEADQLPDLASVHSQRPTNGDTFPAVSRSPTDQLLYGGPSRVDTMRSVAGENSRMDWFLNHFHDDIFNIRVQKVQFRKFHSLASQLGLAPKTVPGSTPLVTMELSIAALSRMRMRMLQMKLSNRIMDMHYLRNVPSDWEDLLEQYISATRDNDYIRTCVERGLHDPFLIKSQRKVDAAILTHGLTCIPPDKLEEELKSDTEGFFNLVPPVEKESNAIGGTRNKMTKKQQSEAFLRRIVVAFLGGAFLVVPMWLMVVVNNQRASLVSTSVFVFVWGLVAAYALSDPIAVLSTTAAYAAVLVVFVGSRD